MPPPVVPWTAQTEITPSSRQSFRRTILKAGLATIGALIIDPAGNTGAESPPRLPGGRAVSAIDREDWAFFKRRFVSPDGRIVDTGNHGVSHSEGQGVGMLLAVAFDDRETFDRLHRWTAQHLRRTDWLHAWRWIPDSPDPVPDTNNATDGDLYIAGALNRAYLRWQAPIYAAAAEAIGQSVLEQLVQTAGRWTVLLPGGRGFDEPRRVTVNLSYYILPLLDEMDAACPSPLWQRLRQDGAALIEASRFGAWSLPPDWLGIARDGALSLAEDHPTRFSYDAVRVPLFLAWAGQAPGVVRDIATFWAQCPAGQPQWADLQTNRIAPFYGSGTRAIAALINHSELPRLSIFDDYYSSSLVLLSRLALREAAHPAVG